MSTVQRALAAANITLKENGFPDAPRDTRRLMAACMDVPVDRLLLHSQDPIGDVTAAAFAAMVQLRLDHVPVSRIIGRRTFFGRAFTISNDVLDPRPETEVLIVQALSSPFQTCLDLGTGSGAIAITLLAENPQARVLATDVSSDALHIAARNAQQIGVDARLSLLESDWFAQVDGTFDLIVSNPPYIAAEEMAELSRDVREHDPHIALTDHADGLTAYRKITAGAAAHLAPKGRLIVEIGPTQGRQVAQMFTDAGFADVQIIPDFDGRDRVVCGQKR